MCVPIPEGIKNNLRECTHNNWLNLFYNLLVSLLHNRTMVQWKTFAPFCRPFVNFSQQSFSLHVDGIKTLVSFANITSIISFILSTHECFLSYQFPIIQYMMTLVITKISGCVLSNTACCTCPDKEDKIDAILATEGGVVITLR